MRSHASDTARSDPRRILTPIEALLGQLAWVVRRLDDAQYRELPARGISGSVGGHVRHCLDHVSALIVGSASGRVTYDHRLRGTAVETCRTAALIELRRLADDLPMLPTCDLDRPIELVASLDTDGTQVTARSSVARELAFVVSHTIHHLAVIALLLRDLSIEVPPRFGYAPSTPTHSATAA
jgi:hypothetical protein